MGPESTRSPGAPQPEEPVLLPGQRLGKYQLVKRLAVGGMAEIFLARVEGIEGFEKLVVLKSILAQHAADDEWVQMFLEEARLAATLQHPNIAQVFDVGREQNVHYFTMEYVEGADLRLIMKAAEPRGGVPLEVAVGLVIGAAAGLHYAHEKADEGGRALGIVHRDVTPANVLLSADGAVKVVDFGIAKAAVRRAATRTGTIKGKAGWISPEQCRGEPLDRRSDIFSLGILLYELTCGVPPFRGENEYAILRQVVEQDAPPPRTVRPDYSPGLEAIVLRCLRRRRDDRYSTAQELQIDLETFAREQNLTISSVELARFMEDLFGKGGAFGDRVGAKTRAHLLFFPGLVRKRRARWLWAAAAAAAIGAGALWKLGAWDRASDPARVDSTAAAARRAAAGPEAAPVPPAGAPSPGAPEPVSPAGGGPERATAAPAAAPSEPAPRETIATKPRPGKRATSAKATKAAAAKALATKRKLARGAELRAARPARPETDPDAPFPR